MGLTDKIRYGSAVDESLRRSIRLDRGELMPERDRVIRVDMDNVHRLDIDPEALRALLLKYRDIMEKEKMRTMLEDIMMSIQTPDPTIAASPFGDRGSIPGRFNPGIGPTKPGTPGSLGDSPMGDDVESMDPEAGLETLGGQQPELDENGEPIELAEEDVPDEELAEEDVPDEELAEEDVPDEELAEEDVPDEELAEEDVPDEELAEEDVPEEEEEEDEEKRKRKKFGFRGDSSYGLLRRTIDAPSETRMDSLKERFGVRSDGPGDWDESKVERDESGKFGSGGSGSGPISRREREKSREKRAKEISSKIAEKLGRVAEHRFVRSLRGEKGAPVTEKRASDFVKENPDLKNMTPEQRFREIFSKTETYEEALQLREAVEAKIAGPSVTQSAEMPEMSAKERQAQIRRQARGEWTSEEVDHTLKMAGLSPTASPQKVFDRILQQSGSYKEAFAISDAVEKRNADREAAKEGGRSTPGLTISGVGTIPPKKGPKLETRTRAEKKVGKPTRAERKKDLQTAKDLSTSGRHEEAAKLFEKHGISYSRRGK